MTTNNRRSLTAVNATVFKFSNDVAEVCLPGQGLALRDAVMLASRAD
jgi:hypothetical protein